MKLITFSYFLSTIICRHKQPTDPAKVTLIKDVCNAHQVNHFKNIFPHPLQGFRGRNLPEVLDALKDVCDIEPGIKINKRDTTHDFVFCCIEL